MFNAASRRACASTSKPLQFLHHRSLSRSLLSTNRPITHLQGYGKQIISPFLSRQPPIQTRHASYTPQLKRGFRKASKRHPFVLSLGIIVALGSVSTLAYVIYDQVMVKGPHYSRYPGPVVKELKTAVWYTDVDLNPTLALQSYRKALKLAIGLGMHPFSDEVMGIKFQVAAMLEKAGLVVPAVEVLERTKAETMHWIEMSRKRAWDVTKKVKNGNEAEKDAIKINDPEFLETQKKEEENAKLEERMRRKALKRIVGVQLKLAELYASDYIQDDKKAEEALVSGVELCLTELQRRQSLGLPLGGAASADDDSWLSLAEMATSFVGLASNYTNQERHALALPLYLRALDMIRAEEGDTPTCKQVVLLNDVASAMAGQAQTLRVSSKSIQKGQTAPSREQAIDAAKQWAQKAIDVAAKVQPPVRDQDCDTSCVAAKYNLGELAEMLNRPDEAGRFYMEAENLARGIGFDEGVTMAETALKRLWPK